MQYLSHALYKIGPREPMFMYIGFVPTGAWLLLLKTKREVNLSTR